MFSNALDTEMPPVLNQSVKKPDYLVNADTFSDVDLFKKIGAGDETALAELYHRYRIPVFRFALHQTQDEAAAEEVLQDVFLAAWQRAGKFRGKASVKTWLLRVTYYRSATWLSRQKQPAALDSMEVLPSDNPGPEFVAVDNWQSSQVQEAIGRLSPKHRAAVELIFYHELTYKEAARVVGCPTGTMKSRVNQAVAQLSRLLTAAGFEQNSE